MSLLNRFNELFNKKERGIATITGQKGGGKVIATTEKGAVIILNGTAETGKKVYYDRRSNDIVGDAPNVEFREYPV
ncbi:MAG: hypothetical protein KGV56_05905 [Gammaproteobacteria bacterium]|nr:hypothetical protein [Gammaproteobacteria bacterium]